MPTLPAPLAALLEDFRFADRNDRADLLIGFADEFDEVSPALAARPFPQANHVVRCESDAYVFPEELPDGTLKFHFAVENPQGLSAKSWAVIMDRTLSGQPLEQVAAVPPDVIFEVY
ncbi:MAG: SufE family protein, partial [Dehalococcoidia bacterium]|nr:SufE family protein [Dehalococcoidia bacterium]